MTAARCPNWLDGYALPALLRIEARCVARPRRVALLGGSFGVLFASALHVGLHLAMGTPEVLRTVTVPILASALDAGGYMTTLRALDRARR